MYISTNCNTLKLYICTNTYVCTNMYNLYKYVHRPNTYVVPIRTKMYTVEP